METLLIVIIQPLLRKINIQTKSKILTILNIIFLPTLIFKKSNIIRIYINAVLALHVTLFLLSSALLFFYFQFSAFYILFNSLLYVKKKNCAIQHLRISQGFAPKAPNVIWKLKSEGIFDRGCFSANALNYQISERSRITKVCM